MSRFIRALNASITDFFKMSPGPKMGDEVKFQQRWEFRRGDDGFDSSSDDSKSSSQSRSVLKKHKMVSDLISLDFDDSGDISRPQQSIKGGPGLWAECVNGEPVQNKKRKKVNLPKNLVKRGSCSDTKRKKSKARADEPSVSEDIKNFIESLLEDLKVAAESLFARMKEEILKLDVDDVTQHKRRASDYGDFGGKDYMLHQNFNEKVTKNQHCSNEGSIPVHPLKDLNSGRRVQNSKGGLSRRRLQRRKAAQSKKCDQTPENQVNFVSAEKDKGERMALTVKADIQSTRLDQNDTMQHQNSVVLAIGAQNSFGGSSVIRKGKKAINPSNHHAVPEDGDCHIIVSTKPTKRNNGDKLGLSADPKLSSHTSCQVASSMYLTLPSILTDSLSSNHIITTSSSNNTQQKIYGNETNVNATRDNSIFDSSTHSGYFSAARPAERVGDLVQMGSRGSFNTGLNGYPGSGITHYGANSGFNVPSQLGLESLSGGNNNLLGLKMNGGAIRRNLRGSYALPEFYSPNILQTPSSYGADDGFMSFQSSDLKDDCPFPK